MDTPFADEAAQILSILQGEAENIEEVAELVQTLLSEKAPMLRACFGMRIDEASRICSFPQLIEGYVPDMHYLPQFVLSLARDVDWDTEQECFEGVAKVGTEQSFRSVLKSCLA